MNIRKKLKNKNKKWMKEGNRRNKEGRKGQNGRTKEGGKWKGEENRREIMKGRGDNEGRMDRRKEQRKRMKIKVGKKE